MASGQPVTPGYPTPGGTNSTAPLGTITLSQPGWFVVREGEIGNLTNIIAKATSALGKITSGITDVLRGQVISAAEQEVAAGRMKTTGQWTVRYVSDREEATVLVNQGYRRYATKAAAQRVATQRNNQSSTASGGILNGLGGELAAGIEHGVIQTLKDIWSAIEPFVEILFGAAIAVIVVAIYAGSSDAGQSLIKTAAAGALFA